MTVGGVVVVSSPMWADVSDGELAGTIVGGFLLIGFSLWSIARLVRRKDLSPLGRVGPIWGLGASIAGVPIALGADRVFTKIWAFGLFVVLAILALVALLGNRDRDAVTPNDRTT
jgi:hypothetical protein